MNAVIYARFSSDKQSEMSIDAQVRACREYAEKKGITITNIYTDEALSGTSAGRPSYQRLLEDAIDEKFDLILIHKYDRIARNLEEQVTLNSRLKKLGINLIAVAQDFGEGNEANLSKGIQWVLGEYYSANLAEETRKGLKETALKALHNGGYAPFGYDVADRKYVINELEAKYVKKMFEYCIKGLPMREVTEELKKLGIKGKRGREIKEPQIYEILKNEKYTGVYSYSVRKGEVIRLENAIPPIISKEEFALAQNIMKKRARSGPTNHHRCSGLVYCAECGAKMHLNNTKRSGHSYSNFICSAKCGAKGVPVSVIDDAVNRYLSMLFSEKNIKDVEFAVKALRKDKIKRAKTFEQSRKEILEKKEKELSNIINALTSGAFDSNYDYLNSLITEKRKEIEELKNIKPSDENDTAALTWLKNAMTNADSPKIFIEKIEAKKTEVNIISTFTSVVESNGCGGAVAVDYAILRGIRLHASA